MNKSDITLVVITNPHDIHITALIDPSQLGSFLLSSRAVVGLVGYAVACCPYCALVQEVEVWTLKNHLKIVDETWRCHLRKVYTSEYWEILHGFWEN